MNTNTIRKHSKTGLAALLIAAAGMGGVKVGEYRGEQRVYSAAAATLRQNANTLFKRAVEQGATNRLGHVYSGEHGHTYSNRSVESFAELPPWPRTVLMQDNTTGCSFAEAAVSQAYGLAKSADVVENLGRSAENQIRTYYW